MRFFIFYIYNFIFLKVQMKTSRFFQWQSDTPQALGTAAPIRGCFESLQHDASACLPTSTNHSPRRHACALLRSTDCCRSRVAGVNGASLSVTAASEQTSLSQRKYINPTEWAGRTDRTA